MFGFIGNEKTESGVRQSSGRSGGARSLVGLAAATLRAFLNCRGDCLSEVDCAIAVDFHLTSDCQHDCPYCRRPRNFQTPVDTATALRIVGRAVECGAKRIRFTGGDPLNRRDIRLMILYAHDLGLETSVATAGENLSAEFLQSVADSLDLVSLPVDGSCEAVNRRTKRRGHFAAVSESLARLCDYPDIDVTISTAVTRHNIEDVPRVLRFVEEYAERTSARVSHEIYRAFPRAISPATRQGLMVSDDEFAALRGRIRADRSVRVQILEHRSLDRPRLVILPDGRLAVPRGRQHYSYGQFLDVGLRECLQASRSAEQDDCHPDSWSS